MTIQITCECGKQLHAPDEFAGRQTRCPTCQRAVTLPGPETAIQPTASPPMPAMAPVGVEANRPEPIEPPPGGPATNQLALWSLILGVVSIFLPCLLSIPAIVLGILGLRAIGRNPQAVGGKGMAVGGLILGVLTVVELGGIFVVGMTMGVRSARMAASRISSVNNLKEIGLACHNYHDAFGYFPSENLRPGMPNRSKLSWRVQIASYLEPNTFDFHHDEPWDSPHNIKALPLMPRVYLDPRFQSEADRAKGLTYYRGFAGPGCMFGNPGPVGIAVIQNLNGMSNTAWVVEAGEAVPWTKPEDPDFNENSPFGGPDRGDFAVLFVDGHVQVIKRNFDRKTIGKMISWQNTEPIALP